MRIRSTTSARVATTMAAFLALTGGALCSLDARAAIIFSDGFESGDLDLSQNGASWGSSESTTVSTDRPYAGRYSLRFTFDGGGAGEDSFSEQRIALPQRPEYWFKYRLFIPSNYNHREDGASNNKFLAVYRDPYREPGFQVNFSMEPNGSGGSSLDARYYNDGSEGRSRYIAGDFITTADRGTWIEIIAQVKVPTSATSNNGIMKIWKNGRLLGSLTDLAAWGGSGQNYIDEAYLLGWANSGFSQTTVFYLDDIVIADAPFDAPTATTPAAPQQLTVR